MIGRVGEVLRLHAEALVNGDRAALAHRLVEIVSTIKLHSGTVGMAFHPNAGIRRNHRCHMAEALSVQYEIMIVSFR